jgi:hypothetical protein
MEAGGAVLLSLDGKGVLQALEKEYRVTGHIGGKYAR